MKPRDEAHSNDRERVIATVPTVTKTPLIRSSTMQHTTSEQDTVMGMSMGEALNLFNRNFSPEDVRISAETYQRLRAAVVKEIEQGANVHHVAAAIITLGLGAVLSVIRAMAHRPSDEVN
jgi:hypothetical protein